MRKPETAISDLVYASIAIFFLWALPERLQRSKLLNLLHQLRSTAHVIDMHQLTKDPEQQNLPGTTAEYPNWRHKMRYSLEELETSPGACDFVALLRAWLVRTGRIEPGAGPAS